MGDASPAVIGRDNDPDFLYDLQIIAKRQPGKGAALQRMLDRAGMTHDELAESVDRSRSSVSTWVSEFRWPDDTTLRNALLALKIDRKLLFNECGAALATGNEEFDPKALAVTLYGHLLFENDPFERERLIYDSLAEKVLIAQGFRGLSDTRAAAFFFERYDKHMEVRRLRAAESQRNVTPRAQEWSSGQSVYEPAKKRNVSPSPGDDAPDRAISGDVKDGE